MSYLFLGAIFWLFAPVLFCLEMMMENYNHYRLFFFSSPNHFFNFGSRFEIWLFCPQNCNLSSYFLPLLCYFCFSLAFFQLPIHKMWKMLPWTLHWKYDFLTLMSMWTSNIWGFPFLGCTQGFYFSMFILRPSSSSLICFKVLVSLFFYSR